MAAPTLYLFDRFDERRGLLPALGPVRHVEELGGEDTIELSCETAPEKGDRILWRDPDDGSWHEHEVVRTDEPAGSPCLVYAESSLSELLRDFVEESQLVSRMAAQAMAAVVAPTRWALGPCEPAGKHGCLLYHTNALAALRRVEEVWGGEAVAEITVSGGRVATRTLSLPVRRGGWRGARFSYGLNVVSCTRTVLEDEVFTALYGFGRGLAILDEKGQPTGGFTRRLTFGSANGGANWVGSEQARQSWGRWDAARRQRVHSFGQVVFPEIDDPYLLLAATRKALAQACAPRVTYEVDVADLGGVPVALGDDVAVVDSSREPAWRLTARVVRRERELGTGEPRRVTLGSALPATWRTAGELVERMGPVEEAAGAAADAADAGALGVTALTERVAALGAAAGEDEGTGEVRPLATRQYVDEAIASLEDLGEEEF